MPDVTEKIVVAYDPDFDPSPDVFMILGGRRAFLVGVLVAVLCLMSIGFLAMMVLIFSGKTIAL